MKSFRLHLRYICIHEELIYLIVNGAKLNLIKNIARDDLSLPRTDAFGKSSSVIPLPSYWWNRRKLWRNKEFNIKKRNLKKYKATEAEHQKKSTSLYIWFPGLRSRHTEKGKQWWTHSLLRWVTICKQPDASIIKTPDM